ncbi:hypothetical protein D3C87_1065930 [compost metagenome]
MCRTMRQKRDSDLNIDVNRYEAEVPILPTYCNTWTHKVISLWANGVMENTPAREYLGGSIPSPPKGMTVFVPFGGAQVRIYT